MTPEYLVLFIIQMPMLLRLLELRHVDFSRVVIGQHLADWNETVPEIADIWLAMDHGLLKWYHRTCGVFPVHLMCNA